MSEDHEIDNYDSESDNLYSSDSNNDESDQDSRKLKKQPIKKEKVPLKEALKTVDERALYTKIDKYFSTECDSSTLDKMVKIIKEDSDKVASLRLINWFAMKHSATMQSLEVKHDDGTVELFDVKISYRARLGTHSKKYFDPFRRGPKFDYNYDKTDKTKIVETTLCQLNFFRWLIMHNLLEYIEEHFEELSNLSGKYNNNEKKKKEIKKKKEKEKKNEVKDKNEEMKLKIKKFEQDQTTKLVIIM